MMRLIFVCNRCGSETTDYKKETGWIHISSKGLLVAGDDDWRAMTGVSFRYTSSIRTSDDDSIDFCSIKCFIEWLYTGEHTRNTNTINNDIETRFLSDVVIPELMSLVKSLHMRS